MGIYIEGLNKQVQKGTESITVTFWDKDELIINEYDIGDMSKVTDLDLVRCRECIHFHYDKPYIIQGIPVLGHEVCDFWGDGCKTNLNGFCSYGEREDE